MDGAWSCNVWGGVLMMDGRIPVQAVLSAWCYHTGGRVLMMDGL